MAGHEMALCVAAGQGQPPASGRGTPFAFQHLNVNRPFLRYANEAALPYYILHQSVLVTVAYFVVQWAIPDWLKFVFILTASFLVSMGLYESLVRRNNPLRILFGMKPKQSVSTDVRSVLAGRGV